MARVFLSHSSRDGAAALWLAEWLRRNGFEAPFLDFDKHSGIPPGADWERTLYREIATSQALVIVQSSHWLASKWCFAEFTQARALGKPIFQLLGVPGVSDGENDDPASRVPITSDLQQLDLRQDQEAGLTALARELTALALHERGGFSWDSARSPYPGLLSFDEEDAAIFFGRDEEIRRLIEQLHMLRIQGAAKVVVLLGASGSGKSSLLRAGVLPRLKRAGRQWLPLPPIRPQRAASAALAQAFSLAFADGRDWRILHQQLREADANHSLSPLLSGLAADLRLARKTPDAQILISVDQAEELFNEGNPEEVRKFFAGLSTALLSEAGFQVVMTLRSDFLGCLQAAEGLAVPLSEVSLPPLPGERMVEIIKGPAEVAGLNVEEAFVQAVIRDVRTDDALPLLAFALRETYDLGGADRLLSLSDYQTLGDAEHQLSPLENAVRRAADGVLQLWQPSDAEILALRDAFVPSLVRVNEQDFYTRRPALWDELPPQASTLLSHLVQARLLTVEQRDQERWVEVAHEALLRNWPLLRQWLDDAREFLVGCQRLEQELRDWQEASKETRTAHLLNGVKLTRAQTWLEDRPQQISTELKQFIEASVANRDQMLLDQRRKQHLIIGGLSLLSLIAGTAWAWGQLQSMAAYEAQTRQYQSVHLSMLKTDPLISMVYGLAAMSSLQHQPNEAVPLALSLRDAATNNHFRGHFLSHQDEVWSMAETPSGRLISGGRDGTLRFWSAEGQPQPDVVFTKHVNGVRGIVAINEQEWWTAGAEGLLQRWRAGQRQGEPVATGHGLIRGLVRTADGNLLSVGTDGMARRWNRLTGRALAPPLPTGHVEVWSVAVLPNGDWVTGGREGNLQWWHQGRPAGSPVPSQQGAVSALVALPSGEVISGGDDGSMQRWSKNRQSLERTNSHHSSIFALLIRRNGFILSGGSERLAAGNNNFIRIWSAHLGHVNGIQPNHIESLSIIQLCNGDLISGGSDGALHHWRGGTKLDHPILTKHRRVYGLAILPSGDLVSGGDDGYFRIWRNGQPVSEAHTHQGGVTSLLIDADGTLFSGGRDGTIQHWTLKDRPRLKSSIKTPHGAVWAMAILPNGDLLSGGDDGYLRRWHQSQPMKNPIKTIHTSVVSIIIRRNGDWVTGGSSGDLQIWRNGQALGEYFHVPSGSVWSLAELRDGALISANGDGTLTIYPTSNQAIQEACQSLSKSGSVLEIHSAAAQAARELCKDHQPGRDQNLHQSAAPS